MVQTAKMLGRFIVEKQLDRRVRETERRERETGTVSTRRKEERLASLEEIYSDEVVFPELL